MSLSPGFLLADRYLLLQRLGAGGMGEVWLARAEGIAGFKKLAAVKISHPHLAADSGFVDMFLDEARISAQLNHINIGQIYDLGQSEGRYFIAMEYIPGRDLQEIYKRARSLGAAVEPALACYVVSEIAGGLGYAHRKKADDGTPLDIVHRDVSPQNCLVSFEGEVKLIDFGVAKAAQRATRSETGTLKGKLGYMAPDQFHGRPVDRRSDIFALGVVLYELLIGERLFTGDSEIATMEKVRRCEIPQFDSTRISHPPGLEAVVHKALALAPEDRFQWAEDFQAGLRPFLTLGGRVFGRSELAAYMAENFDRPLIPDAPASAGDTGTKVVGPPPLPSEKPAPQAIDINLVVEEPVYRGRRGRWVLGIVVFLFIAAGAGFPAWQSYLSGDASSPPTSIESGPAIGSPAAPRTVLTPQPAAPDEDAARPDLVEPSPSPAVDEPVDVPPAVAAVPKRPPRKRRRRPRPTPNAALSPAPQPIASAGGSEITLDANTRADVWIDGKLVGQTPIEGRPIAAGRHRIRFDCYLPTGKHRGPEKSIRIPPDTEASIFHECTVGQME